MPTKNPWSSHVGTQITNWIFPAFFTRIEMIEIFQSQASERINTMFAWGQQWKSICGSHHKCHNLGHPHGETLPQLKKIEPGASTDWATEALSRHVQNVR